MTTRAMTTRATRSAALADKAAEAARLLEALANPRRLATLCRLAQGERTVGELAAAEGLSLSALSQHLGKLREEGLVTTRREGQTIHYRLADPRVRKIIEVLHREFCS
ncbi:MAG: ArsR/SmtB family transcription factor [Gemmatimonas sp.]